MNESAIDTSKYHKLIKPVEMPHTPYPKMLYKGERIYSESDELNQALASRRIKTVIVANEEEEGGKRDDGWVNLAELIMEPRKTPIFASAAAPAVNAPALPPMHELVMLYQQKFGKPPHKRMKPETIAKALA